MIFQPHERESTMSEETLSNTEEGFTEDDQIHADTNNEADQSDDVVDASFAPEPTPQLDPFSLTKERFVLASINTRGEKHGDERVPALYLKFKATLSNSILLKLHPGLRDALYVHDRQRDIENDYGRKLRFPLLGGFPYALEIPRVKLRVHDCDSESNDVVLIDGEANKFSIMPMEGGSVAIAFRVQFSDYDTDVLASLARVLQQTVPISLSSESAEDAGDNFDQAEKLAQEPMSPARLAAESLFSNLPDDQSDVDAVVAAVTGDQAEAGEQALADGIADAEQEAAAEEGSNVTPIKTRRTKRTAGGAE